MATCQICNKATVNPLPHPGTDRTDIDCDVCGQYSITRRAKINLGTGSSLLEYQRAVLSHYVRRQSRSEDVRVVLRTEVIDELCREGELPGVDEQMKYLVSWVGDISRVPGLSAEGNDAEDYAVVGAIDRKAFQWLVNSAIGEGFIEHARTKSDAGLFEAKLTLAGWKFYQEIRHGRTSSNKVFIAMEYGHDELDRFVERTIKPSLDEIGMDLVRLDESLKPGLIDIQLRHEIETCAVFLADLSHENAGAYWEAGYADGLGKPVIYLCNREKFEQDGTHFDTNHHFTVIWDQNDPEKVASQLKAAIKHSIEV